MYLYNIKLYKMLYCFSSFDTFSEERRKREKEFIHEECKKPFSVFLH